MEEVDVVVVGAGFAGLSAAKTYLQCAPETNIVLLDANPTIGGVWSVDKIYPTLRSNNQLGTFELPDYPMHEGFGVKAGEHIPGMVVHRYLCEFAEAFDLTKRIKLSTKVLNAEKLDGNNAGWLLQTRTSKTEENLPKSSAIKCKKLIIATGLTSQPQSVHYSGEDVFEGPIINSAALASEGVKMIQNTAEGERQVTVLGGSKSAYDAVYMFASNGFAVHWVIRKSGYGPTWMAPAHIKAGPLRLWLERLPCTRLFASFSPCLWNASGQDGWFRRFLHGGNALGAFVVQKFWNKLGNDVVTQTTLRKTSDLGKLIPDKGIFNMATGIAILNYQNSIHDFITSGKVTLYRQDVSHLSSRAVNLSDGTILRSPGGLVTATTWQWAPNLEISPKSLHSSLGIPSTEYSSQEKYFWHKLDHDAEAEIIGRFPMLGRSPQKIGETSHIPAADATGGATIAKEGSNESLEPYRLYRFIAPPGLTAKGDRSIVFQGFVANLINQVRNDLTGLWAYAYLNDKLEIDEHDVCWQAALWNRFCKCRYSYGYGGRFPDFVHEQVPFFDQLLKDLGLRHRRKSTWLKELIEPYGQADYRGITEEWLRLQAVAKDTQV